jgi:RNA polymerase-binding protein DksA
MNDTTAPRYDALARRLAQRRQQLRDEIAAKRAPDPLPATDVQDQKDQADARSMGEVAAAEIERDYDELRQIDAALRRIDSGQYGICVDCGAMIDTQRLQAQPAVARCTACQTALEQQQQQLHARGAAR